MNATTADGGSLWFEEGGSGDPTLVLLHGLGANASVWDPLIPIVREAWPHRWIAPDFRGHGRSGHASPYGYAVHAADVAATVGGQGREIVILGHSMGGAVAMALATGWFGVTVNCALAFGVKISWTEEEIARLKDLAARPVCWFDERDQAIDRYLKVSGLIGLVAPDSHMATAGVVEENGRFRLAADNVVNAVAGPELATFYHAADARVRLAAGGEDRMCTLDDMRVLDLDAVVLDGLGHNCHVERPDIVWRLFEDTFRPSWLPTIGQT